MSRCQYTVDDVRRILDQLIQEDPHRRDHHHRAARGGNPRYLEGSQPCCLIAVLMERLGISVGLLRSLDREEGGYPARLKDSRHPVRKRFTPLAWELMDTLQADNDYATTWAQCRWGAFHLDEYWMNVYPKNAYDRRPWVTEANRITAPRPAAPPEQGAA